MTQTLTQDRLKELLHYDPETGLFTRRVGRRGKAKAGDVAGAPDKDGYLRFRVDSKRYPAHRLAFFYMNGEWPKDEVDHRDLNKGNNAWLNLREATRVQNLGNQGTRKNNKVGLKGVCRDKSKFVAEIIFNGKRMRLGSFNTPEEAHAAYAKAANENHGEFARTA